MIPDVCQVNPEASITLDADTGNDAAEFIQALPETRVAPHVKQNKSNGASVVPEEIASTAGCGISMRNCKLIEQTSSWTKFAGSIRQTMVRGIKNGDQVFMLVTAAFDLVRMRTSAQIRLGAW